MKLSILKFSIFAVICFLIGSSSVFADSLLSLSDWEKLYKETRETDRRGGRTLQSYEELITRNPEGVPPDELSICYLQLARKFDDLHEQKSHLLKAIDLAKHATVKSPELCDAFSDLSYTCMRLGEYRDCETFAKMGMDYAAVVYGKSLRSGSSIVVYATAAAKNRNYKFAEELISKVDEMCKKASLEERRDYETQLLFEVASAYQASGDFSSAEKYFRRAIYAAESLWYPLCDWCGRCFSNLVTCCNEQGQYAESDRVFARALSIQKTGNDPLGVDICKFWNGQKAPEDMRVVFSPYEVVSEKEMQKRRTQPPRRKALSAMDKDPLVVYKKYLKRIQRSNAKASH